MYVDQELPLMQSKYYETHKEIMSRQKCCGQLSGLAACHQKQMQDSEITFHLELQLQGVALALFLQNIICKKCVLINIECHSNIKTRVGQNICIHTQECISIYIHIYNAI